MKVHPTTACYPGGSWYAAVSALMKNPHEPFVGGLSLNRVQLCPQNAGILDGVTVSRLMMDFPTTEFRMHANVRVGSTSFSGGGDAASIRTNEAHFAALAAMQIIHFGTAPYTLHAGRRASCTLDQMRDNVLRLQDRMGTDVGVEGHYPDNKNTWLINCWDEYEWLLDSGLHYALDLSHLNIVAREEGWNAPLLVGLLESPMCIEIHISDNRGQRDDHRVITTEPSWWRRLLKHRNPNAAVFSEGNHAKHQQDAYAF
jgi:hypothetical protein